MAWDIIQRVSSLVTLIKTDVCDCVLCENDWGLSYGWISHAFSGGVVVQ